MVFTANGQPNDWKYWLSNWSTTEELHQQDYDSPTLIYQAHHPIFFTKGTQIDIWERNALLNNAIQQGQTCFDVHGYGIQFILSGSTCLLASN